MSFAQVEKTGITVEKAYMRASIPGSDISSPRVEIHQHTMVAELMRMRKINVIIIKANERVILQPSGLHLMLFDVKKPLKSKHKVELTLRFSDKKSVSLKVPVYSPMQEKSAQEADSQLSKMQHHHH